MKYIKSYVLFNENVKTIKKEFVNKIEKWNENFSRYFKFQNDKANVPNDLETEEAPDRNGASYGDIVKIGLRNLADLMLDHKDSKIKIDVHTDSTEPSDEWESNEKISQVRGENIKKYLLSKGIDDSRVQVEGKGFQEPIVEDDSENPDAQFKNKRVVVSVI